MLLRSQPKGDHHEPNTYARLSKSALTQIVRESGAVIGAAISDLRKADAARIVAAAVAQTGWLPVPLRSREEAPAVVEAR